VGNLSTSGGGTIRRHSSGAIQRGGFARGAVGVEKTRRVSFELDPVSLSTPREVSLDSAPTSADAENVVRCRYSKCGKMASLAEARRTFKTCHNCNAQVYCSRECRRAHWEKGHRKTCLHGRIGALCRRVANACKEHQPSLELLSRLARRGYLAHGRGCVKIFFSSPEIAERFAAAVAAGSAANDPLLPGDPCFVRWSDLLPTEMGNEQYKELLRLCKGYNPDTRLVVYVATCVVSEVPSSGAVKWERQIITRCAKVRLHKNHTAHAQSTSPPLPTQEQAPAQQQAITRDLDNPETLILTPLSLQPHEATQRRELIAANIQRQLKQRGVSLRKQFPEVYRKLGVYVESSEPFTPVTIYPKDSASGRTFMCIIMPVADPDRLQDVPTDSSRVRTVDVGSEPSE